MLDAHVLVTGGSGFIAGHTIKRLLDDGYRVRTTVRSLAREGAVRAVLRVPQEARLTFAAADLGSEDGWSAAVADCEYVLHVASPFPPAKPKDENEVIRPAVEGTLRVLETARGAGVRRGERFLAAAGQPLTMPEIAAILRSRLGPAASRVPTREVPDWLVRAAARVVPPLRELAGLLGPPKSVSAAKTTELLGWQPFSAAEAIAATGESLTVTSRSAAAEVNPPSSP